MQPEVCGSWQRDAQEGRNGSVSRSGGCAQGRQALGPQVELRADLTPYPLFALAHATSDLQSFVTIGSTWVSDPYDCGACAAAICAPDVKLSHLTCRRLS
jgi:hypothetical protein